VAARATGRAFHGKRTGGRMIGAIKRNIPWWAKIAAKLVLRHMMDGDSRGRRAWLPVGGK
jgi:hypothetical protein